MPACAGLLKPKGSRLKLLKCAFNAKKSCAGCLGLSPAISSQFTLKMCAAAKNCRKFSIKPFLGVQDRLRSSMLTNLKSLLPEVVMICSKSVSICNRFHTIKANSGKITFLGVTPVWRLCSRGTPSLRGTKFCHDKPESLGQPTVKISWS